ncbi:MAG: di-trans,poly-cis-decaprenylcistransferase [Alphaproteobacteria bacterium]|nr:di-trans,poly-cis-decaprenylcistransferase [Alphaproteobacteria bacterium]
MKIENINHIAFIMDGNSTWARKQNKPVLDGYLAGMRKLAHVICYLNSIKIPYVTCYAFSSENWLRPKVWIDSFMKLATDFMKNDPLIQTVLDAKIKLKVIGNKSKLPKTLQETIKYYEDLTSHNDGTLMQLAMSYGSRDEIVRAVNRIINSKLEINEENISNNLDTSGVPDPDLIIRTSSKKRLSNFLLWQASYSEFYSSDLLWPDFNNEELEKALKDFNSRTRTYGR